MIRFRSICTVKYGMFREFLQAFEDLDNLCKERGWATSTSLVPVVGDGNGFVAEYDYPDLATFQAEGDAQMSDPDYMKIFRGAADFVYPQSVRSELYENAPRLA